MTLKDKQLKLLDFVIKQHGSQVRKYTGNPYWIHTFRVGQRAEGFIHLGFEIGLCHDLLEDTECTTYDLTMELDSIGYSVDDILRIVDCTVDLTDVYTTEAYPDLNRKIRKQKEAERLWKIDVDSQTVKYCDLIDNSESILQHDVGFARTYMAEKKEIMKGMIHGDPALEKEVNQIINEYYKNYGTTKRQPVS